MGDLRTVLTMPADFAINLLAASVPPRTAGNQQPTTDNQQPVWKEHGNGTRTMRINSMDQLYKIFPKSTDESKGLRL